MGRGRQSKKGVKLNVSKWNLYFSSFGNTSGKVWKQKQQQHLLNFPGDSHLTFLLYQFQKHLEEMGGWSTCCMQTSQSIHSLVICLKLLQPNTDTFIFAIDLKYLTKLCVLLDEHKRVQVSYSLQIKKNTHYCAHAPTIQNIHKIFVSWTLDTG